MRPIRVKEKTTPASSVCHRHHSTVLSGKKNEVKKEKGQERQGGKKKKVEGKFALPIDFGLLAEQVSQA